MSKEETPVDTPAEEPASTAEEAPHDTEDREEQAPAGEKQTGTVKWFSVQKGFGFVTPDEGEGELFVHQTSIVAEGFRSLREGERVEFDTEVSEDGRAKAINVTGPDGAPPQGAPRRVYSAAPYPPVPAYPQYAVAYPPFPRAPAGRMPGRAIFPGPARGYGYGRGYPPMERPPPPGTPGVSSGFQVVVHNLPWAMTWQELKDTFAHTPGVVRADVIIDSAGRSRGFGTVRYGTREEAEQAVEMMNNTEIGGRVVSVRIDRFA